MASQARYGGADTPGMEVLVRDARAICAYLGSEVDADSRLAGWVAFSAGYADDRLALALAEQALEVADDSASVGEVVGIVRTILEASTSSPPGSRRPGRSAVAGCRAVPPP
jgi:hypothetical protein